MSWTPISFTKEDIGGAVINLFKHLFVFMNVLLRIITRLYDCSSTISTVVEYCIQRSKLMTGYEQCVILTVETRHSPRTAGLEQPENVHWDTPTTKGSVHRDHRRSSRDCSPGWELLCSRHYPLWNNKVWSQYQNQCNQKLFKIRSSNLFTSVKTENPRIVSKLLDLIFHKCDDVPVLTKIIMIIKECYILFRSYSVCLNYTDFLETKF